MALSTSGSGRGGRPGRRTGGRFLSVVRLTYIVGNRTRFLRTHCLQCTTRAGSQHSTSKPIAEDRLFTSSEDSVAPLGRATGARRVSRLQLGRAKCETWSCGGATRERGGGPISWIDGRQILLRARDGQRGRSRERQRPGVQLVSYHRDAASGADTVDLFHGSPASSASDWNRPPGAMQRRSHSSAAAQSDSGYDTKAKPGR